MHDSHSAFNLVHQEDCYLVQDERWFPLPGGYILGLRKQGKVLSRQDISLTNRCCLDSWLNLCSTGNGMAD